MSKYMLRIRRTVTTIQLVPVDEVHYPGMTPDEARDYELELDPQDLLEAFGETLQSADFESLGEELQSYPIGSAVQDIEIIDLDNWPKK